ncbi:MAG: 16S rRNA (cytidine(1402)-2'-O)-methyltransferase [Clostridia bacterium]|nr:16S rRNA (cytidine(1402)-2'-O)-methyltransferase [Clostridia bacterium]
MLYLVGTPIGNLKDITGRALETLAAVDYIACEDTRHSGMMLNHYGIKKPLISYYKHREQESSERILGLLKEGKNVAIISDAGMPCISDPGSVLVAKAREEGCEICVIPGPSAVVSAVTLAGISGGFVFLEFLAEKTKDRKAQLEPFINSPLPLVMYCSPHDLDKTLNYLSETLGDRKLQIVKEITKIYEGVEITTLAIGTQRDKKGEYVLIVEGKDNKFCTDLSVEDQLIELMGSGLCKKDAIKKVAEQRKVKKDDIYKIAINIK